MDRVPDNPNWIYLIKRTLNDNFNTEWDIDVNSKSSLTNHRSIKPTPGLETYLLDKVDFHGASLKFKLRSNTLPLEYKVSKWNKESNGMSIM